MGIFRIPRGMLEATKIAISEGVTPCAIAQDLQNSGFAKEFVWALVDSATETPVVQSEPNKAEQQIIATLTN